MYVCENLAGAFRFSKGCCYLFGISGAQFLSDVLGCDADRLGIGAGLNGQYDMDPLSSGSLDKRRVPEFFCQRPQMKRKIHGLGERFSRRRVQVDDDVVRLVEAPRASVPLVDFQSRQIG